MAEQYARGLWGRFAPDESPFAEPNGMEDNLRWLDDHLGLYTLQPPLDPTSPEPTNPSPGDGQIFTDGTYSVFNGGEWRAYPARKGLRAVLAVGTESWLNTGGDWQQFSVVDTSFAIAAVQPLVSAAADSAGIAASQVNRFASAADALNDAIPPVVPVGGYFNLLNVDGNWQSYRRTAVEPYYIQVGAPSASAGRVDAIARAQALVAAQPNLIPASAQDGLEALPQRPTHVSSAIAWGALANTPCWVVTSPNGATSERNVFIGFLSRSQVGSPVSASLSVLAVDAVPAGESACRVLLQQFDAANVEIASARQEQLICGPSGLATAQIFEFSSVALHPDCANVSLTLGVSSVGAGAERKLYFRDVLLAPGSNAKFRRPPLIATDVAAAARQRFDVAISPKQLGAFDAEIEKARATEPASPNLVSLLAAQYVGMPQSMSTVWPVLTTSADGGKAWRVTAAAGSSAEVGHSVGPFARADLPSAKVSASVRIAALDASNSGQARIVLDQYDAAGAQIAAARWQNVFGGSTAQSDVVLTTPPGGIALDPACSTVRFYIAVAAGLPGSPGVAARNLDYRDLMVCDGASARWRRPAALARPNSGDMTRDDCGLTPAGAVRYAADVAESPNLFAPGCSDFTSFAPLFSSTPPVASSYAGTRTWVWKANLGGSAEVGFYAGAWARAQLGDMVSAGITVQGLTASTAGQARVLLTQHDSSGAEITAARQTKSISTTAAISTPTRFQFDSVALHASCATVRLYVAVQGASTDVTARELHLRDFTMTRASTGAWRASAAAGGSAAAAGGMVWVNGSAGLDTAAGTAAAPLKTVNAAIDKLSGIGTVIVQESTIDPISLAAAKNLTIAADRNAQVRVIAASPLTGATKTGGYTNVYQIALATAPSAAGTANGGTGDYAAAIWVWLHGVPEGLISDTERHPLQRGRQYRLPSTRLWRITTSIADLDAATRPSWYHSGGVLYFNIAAAVGAPNAATATLYVPSATAGVGGAAAGAVVRVDGIQSWYGQEAFNMSGLAYHELTNCQGLGARLEACRTDNTRGRHFGCEWAGAQNDGLNCHSSANANNVQSVVESHMGWYHDNADDGSSFHERGISIYVGGLSEYNGDRGFAPAGGCHSVGIGLTTRKNGQIDTVGGEGYGTVNTVASDEGGIGTQSEWIDCLSDQDRYGFAAHAADAKVIARRCQTRGASLFGYHANAGGIVQLYDCGDSGSAAVKGGPGTIAVTNTNLVN
ncbi:hypothetical protein [uncultured Pseudacidovorax sp.]|uniref:hypothetical protein n=1 Tax=uncultured Pseudacidovorax sp. TaxID=679313 RepID=UPI0025F14F47|nr:hypothetical protein [uncultured Pseudacidovorax sp.]